MDLKGKRLLLLGGTNNALEIKDYAEKNGIVLIVTSLGHNAILSSIAEETYSISTMDVDGLIRLIHDKNIDGLFCGGNEDIIWCAIEVCEKTGLPMYSDRELWSATTNKKLFKQICVKYEVPVVPQHLMRKESILLDASHLHYPVVMKPVDSCGSRGVVLCENSNDLMAAYEKTLSFSKLSDVIVEDYIVGEEVVIYYTFCDGDISFTSMGDKYLNEAYAGLNPLADAYLYPSKYLGEYTEKLDSRVRKVLIEMGIKNGIISLQGFYSNGNFTFFEIGYRLGGTSQHRYTSILNGVNSLEMLMNYSLTGKMLGYDSAKETPRFKKPCCTYSMLSKGGEVARIEGEDIVRNMHGVIAFENRYMVGDKIEVTHTTAQFHMRVFLVGDSIPHLKQLISDIKNTLKVYDINGKSMLDESFDVERIDCGDSCEWFS